MDPTALAFATALVSAMATQTWSDARAAVLAVWRRRKAEAETETVAADLDLAHERVLSAGETGHPETVEAVVDVWQGRVQELLLDHPELAADLREVLTTTLLPMLDKARADRARSIIMTGTSRDSSTFNQVAGDQHHHHG
ncbi:hypothetical protein BJY16_008184 [Actinoplanes octamycinicus]|uniref:Uncharacterized protein n=1 Tax=Actinoplanes octamycinicus TaxID=135948 RepID=A0A7W7H645_9ACTN|nr:hypothetical protein [Actinoplanes octamycinicus]MBB4744725.1 hypothetical protein [Actinoplanes octamycinicus]GIE55307.1 hypothetical protein Aoc01nite_07090 [Actinoplanes octamycinicus]